MTCMQIFRQLISLPKAAFISKTQPFISVGSRHFSYGFQPLNTHLVIKRSWTLAGVPSLGERTGSLLLFHHLRKVFHFPIRSIATDTEVIAAVPGKKRNNKRKAGTIQQPTEDESRETIQNVYPVVAYATCEEMNLEYLRRGLIAQDLYIPTVWTKENDSALHDAIHVLAKYPISEEPREIFFFREGTVVFWNVPELERYNVLKFLKDFQVESYSSTEVMQESEFMLYTHSTSDQQHMTKLSRGKIYLQTSSNNVLLDKYTVANALALSVKLGIWESTLDRFVDSIDHITEELKGAKRLRLTRPEVLQKTGELFSLRNELNLNSDLLDTPDFYWEHEDLENLYHKMFNYLNISRRTNVMNDKLSQCCELLELISGYLNDRHHTRLEWMIIALISVEVIIGLSHVIERSFPG